MRETESVMKCDELLTRFRLLHPQLPPALMSAINYPACARFVALCYYGTKATWMDGRASGTFSYYSIWQPVTEHPALAIDLKDRNLGSDAEPPADAIICDRRERRMYVGDIDEVINVLKLQFEDGTVSSDEYSKRASEFLQDEVDLRRAGLFELFIRPDERAQRETAQLNEWFDSFIDEELLGRYCETPPAKSLLYGKQYDYLKRFIESCVAEKNVPQMFESSGER